MTKYNFDRNQSIFLAYIHPEKTNGLVKNLARKEKISNGRIYKIIHEHRKEISDREDLQYACCKALNEDFRNEFGELSVQEVSKR